jgi:hypothetical protein
VPAVADAVAGALQEASRGGMVKCPACKTLNVPGAAKCKNCGHELAAVAGKAKADGRSHVGEAQLHGRQRKDRLGRFADVPGVGDDAPKGPRTRVGNTKAGKQLTHRIAGTNVGGKSFQNTRDQIRIRAMSRPLAADKSLHLQMGALPSELKNAKDGDVVTLKSALSPTGSEQVSTAFGGSRGGDTATFKARKGTLVHNQAATGMFPGEDEQVLPKGTRIRVVKRNGMTTFETIPAAIHEAAINQALWALVEASPGPKAKAKSRGRKGKFADLPTLATGKRAAPKGDADAATPTAKGSGEAAGPTSVAEAVAAVLEADGPKMKLGNKPGKTNWVEKAGGLPSYIRRIAEHVKGKNPGWDDGRAIAVAVNAAKKMCASGDVNFPGKQNVNAGSRAEACAAVASWESKKGRGKVSEAALDVLGGDEFDARRMSVQEHREVIRVVKLLEDGGVEALA